ncbi:hypothetical protein FHJ31_16175 [Pseudomonas sp. Fig-3]|uniref:Uncharacterized protein n=1 Tax=Pseudomonas rhizophila TaxID=2045200 RepID=A0ABN5JTY9_9PSED|nr:hypothetical protein CRX69_15995 [Pseudomonas rhizophila]MBD0701621.1 hypothetical protein [Pseudomonas sp. PSB1]TNB83182.1 hypothetical protein FHJ31_16175 [Pseudomonas sp. Fig-3]
MAADSDACREQCIGGPAHRIPLLIRRLQMEGSRPVIPLTNLVHSTVWVELPKTLEQVYKNASKNNF